MATVIDISKLPDEAVAQAVDFAPVLLPGESVSSGAVQIDTDPPGGVTTGIITNPGSSGDTVTFDLAAGVSGTRYLIDALATLNTGQVIGQRLRLTVL